MEGIAAVTLARVIAIPSRAQGGNPLPPPRRTLTFAGETRLAAGKGFYDWTGRDVKTERARASCDLVALLDFLGELNREAEAEPPARDLPPR